MNQSIRLASLALALLVPSPGLLASVPSRPFQEASEEAPAEDFSKIGTDAWMAEVRLKLKVDGGSMKSHLQSELRRLLHWMKERKGEPAPTDWVTAVLRLETRLSSLGAPKTEEAPAEVQVNGKSIRRTVESALTRKDHSLIKQMGPSIVHVLEAILLEMKHPAEEGQYAIAPLEELVELDPASGMTTARVLLTRPEKGWPTIVANACGGDWLRGMKSPQELVQSDAYAVMVQLQSSAELSSYQRALLLNPFLTAGVRNEEVTMAARAVSGELMGIKKFGTDATRWLQDKWLRDQDPQLRFRMATWLVGNQPGMDQLEQMMEDTSASVRSLVPGALYRQYFESGRVTPSASVLWTQLLNDSEPQVRQAFYSAISESFRGNRVEILSAELMQDLARILDSPSERDLAGGLPKQLCRGMGHQSKGDQYPTLLAAILQSSLPEVEPDFLGALDPIRRNPHQLAELIDRIDWSRDWGNRFARLEGASRQVLHELPMAERLMWLARWIQRPAMPAQFIQDLMKDKDSRDSIALEVLPASDAVSVLVHERVRAGGWVRGMLHGTNWSWAQTELETALRGAESTPYQMLLARMALASIPSAFEATLPALVADLVAPKVDRMEASEKEIGVLLRELKPEESEARRRLFLALLAEPAVPSGILHQFYDLGLDSTNVSDEAMATILDGLNERLAKAGSQPEPLFIGVAGDSLGRMLQNPDLFREGLVREWTRNAYQYSAGARAAQAADRGDMIPAMRNHLIRAIEDKPSNANYYLEQVFSVEDQATLQAMVGLAYSTTSAYVRDGILARIRTRAEMMELEAQLNPSAEGPTREDALAELVVMMEDPSEVVRVEAIRSIATMGAVEYIPRLIAFLTSDSDAEKQAARVALDTLHRQAASKN